MTDQALPIDPESGSIVEDIRRKMQEKAAVKRGTMWEQMGCPTSKPHMPRSEYDREYRGRIWCTNKSVFEQLQEALKIVICPKCIKEESYGAIEGTRFYATVEDDVMTVFPAVGHFLCHHCGFEEWHPLRHDPRKKHAENAQEESTAAQIRMQQQHAMRQMQAQGMVGGGQALAGLYQSALQNQLAQQSALQNQLAQQIAKGIQPGMGPIYGMTDEEQNALHRLYQQNRNNAVAPPQIVSTRAEAEELLKLAPIERRQSIIQKMRDKGLF